MARDMEPRLKDWLNSQGYKVGAFLGNGAFGSVYDLGGGLVIKVTSQDEDFVNASKLLTLRMNGISPPCLPRPGRVIKFEKLGFGLIREDYRNVDWPMDLSHRFLCLIQEGAHNFQKKYPEYNATILETMPQHYGKWLAFVETAEFCHEFNFRLSDTHGANWGTDAAGIPVFRDIGHCVFRRPTTQTFEFVNAKMDSCEVREKEAA